MAEIKIEDLYSKGGIPLQTQVQKNSMDIASLKLDVKQTGGTPVLSAAWVQLRAAMWNGYVAADGQTLNRADYPDAWDAIAIGKVPVVTEADWLADPAKRGCFTLGDGTTTFRVPDYNGKSEGSLGAAVFRGDGKNAAPAGNVQGDAIRNIEGTWTEFYGGLPNDPSKYSGAFELLSSGAGTAGNNLSVAKGITARFSAARVVPTAEENRMVNVAGCWAIKLFHEVQNAGSIDAATLATQLAEAQSKIYELEAKQLAYKPKKVWKQVRDASKTWSLNESVNFGVDMRSKTIMFEVIHNGGGSTTIAATNNGDARNYWVYGSWEYQFEWINNTTLKMNFITSANASPLYRVWIEDYE